MSKWLALVAAVFAVTPVLSAEPEPQLPLDELDEVVVSGLRLGDQIIDLENRFYTLYNELNKEDQFDMFCTLIPIRRGSAEMTRACLPKLYADAYSDSINWYYRCQAQPVGCYTPPDPTLVLFARNQDLSKNMLKVINSDPRLKEMNRERTELEIRLRTMQANFAQMKRDEVDENGETRAERLERQRCVRPVPDKINKKPCAPRPDVQKD